MLKTRIFYLLIFSIHFISCSKNSNKENLINNPTISSENEQNKNNKNLKTEFLYTIDGISKKIIKFDTNLTKPTAITTDFKDEFTTDQRIYKNSTYFYILKTHEKSDNNKISICNIENKTCQKNYENKIYTNKIEALADLFVTDKHVYILLNEYTEIESNKNKPNPSSSKETLFNNETNITSKNSPNIKIISSKISKHSNHFENKAFTPAPFPSQYNLITVNNTNIFALESSNNSISRCTDNLTDCKQPDILDNDITNIITIYSLNDFLFVSHKQGNSYFLKRCLIKESSYSCTDTKNKFDTNIYPVYITSSKTGLYIMQNNKRIKKCKLDGTNCQKLNIKLESENFVVLDK